MAVLTRGMKGKTQLLRTLAQSKNPPVDSFSEISDYIALYKEKHQKELTLNKHEKAEEIREMMNSFSRQAQRSLFNKRCRTAISSLSSRHSITQGEMEELASETERKREEFESIMTERKNNLIRKQNREIQGQMAKKPVETPVEFRRRSPELLEMMRQERRLFYQSRFDEAAKLRKDCERMDAIEAEKGQKMALDHWSKEMKQLHEKHARELEHLDMWIDARREEFEAENSQKAENGSKRLNNLEYDIKDRTNIMRRSLPHAIRRSLLFDQSKSRAKSRDIKSFAFDRTPDELCRELPERSREIILQSRVNMLV